MTARYRSNGGKALPVMLISRRGQQRAACPTLPHARRRTGTARQSYKSCAVDLRRSSCGTFPRVAHCKPASRPSASTTRASASASPKTTATPTSSITVSFASQRLSEYTLCRRSPYILRLGQSTFISLTHVNFPTGVAEKRFGRHGPEGPGALQLPAD